MNTEYRSRLLCHRDGEESGEGRVVKKAARAQGQGPLSTRRIGSKGVHWAAFLQTAPPSGSARGAHRPREDSRSGEAHGPVRREAQLPTALVSEPAPGSLTRVDSGEQGGEEVPGELSNSDLKSCLETASRQEQSRGCLQNG